MTIFLALITIRKSWFNDNPTTFPNHPDPWDEKVQSINTYTDNTHTVETLTNQRTCCPWITPILWFTLREVNYFRSRGVDVIFNQLSRGEPQMRLADTKADRMRRLIKNGHTAEARNLILPPYFIDFPLSCFHILRTCRIIHDLMWSRNTHNKGTPGVYWEWHPEVDLYNNYALYDFRVWGTLDTTSVPSINFIEFRIAAIDHIRTHPDQRLLQIPCRYPDITWHYRPVHYSGPFPAYWDV